MNVCEYLDRAVVENGNRPALICGTGDARDVLSFSALARQVDRAAATLMQRGLKPGNRVLLAVPLSAETYISMLAALRAGVVVMYVDPAHGPGVVNRCLADHPPAAIVGSRSVLLASCLSREARRIPQRIVARELCGSENCAESAGRGKVARRADADAALLSFTSGSTGQPKPVVRSHGFLRKQLQVLRRVADAGADDIDLVTMPMFVLFNLANAVASVIPACSVRRPGRADPKIILRQLRDERASRIVAAPALLESLVDHCLRSGSTIPDLTCISTGGGPVSPTLPGRLRTVAPNAVVRCVYGSTEAEPISVVDDNDVSVADRRRMAGGAGLLAGHPVPGCELRLLPVAFDFGGRRLSRQRFARLCLGQGEIGEITVSGKHVLPGYADPARDAGSKIDVDGIRWHRTGDAGYLDARGRLWLVGRCSAAIDDRRGTLYPFQAEFAVAAIPGIRRAALLRLGGRRVLVVESSGGTQRGTDVAALPPAVRRQVDQIVTVRRIPMDRRHDSKIDYPRLRSRLGGRFARLRFGLLALVWPNRYDSRPSSCRIHLT